VSAAVVYSEEELDALREIVNVAIGRAGSALARMLDRFVRLPVPRLRLVDTASVASTIRELIGPFEPLCAVRQAFYGRASGEVVVLFDDRTFHEISELLGGGDAVSEEEQLLDVSNILAGVCVEGVAEQLGCVVSYSPPSIMVKHGCIDDVLRHDAAWQSALLVEVGFRLDGRAFTSHVLAFWPDAALAEIRRAIRRFLDAI
jgi:chemotaxis protein CheC